MKCKCCAEQRDPPSDLFYQYQTIQQEFEAADTHGELLPHFVDEAVRPLLPVPKHVCQLTAEASVHWIEYLFARLTSQGFDQVSKRLNLLQSFRANNPSRFTHNPIVTTDGVYDCQEDSSDRLARLYRGYRIQQQEEHERHRRHCQVDRAPAADQQVDQGETCLVVDAGGAPVFESISPAGGRRDDEPLLDRSGVGLLDIAANCEGSQDIHSV